MRGCRFGTSINNIYGTKFDIYNPFELFTIMFQMNFVFGEILPYTKLRRSRGTYHIVKCDLLRFMGI